MYVELTLLHQRDVCKMHIHGKRIAKIENKCLVGNGSRSVVARSSFCVQGATVRTYVRKIYVRENGIDHSSRVGVFCSSLDLFHLPVYSRLE
jgi:hypothetical protein